MIKVRDGYAKLINTSYTGDISLVLLSNGGTIGYDISTNTILATIGSNVASADKLKNKVKIWGLDFDGSSDVAGDLLLGSSKILGEDSASIVNARDNHLVLGYGYSEKGWSTYLDGNSTYFRYGTSHLVGMFLDSSGKVGIGTISPSAKLHVIGVTQATNFISGDGVNDFSAGTVKLDTLNIPTSSGGTTFGPGSNGQVLKSNGTTVYWASDNNSNTWRAIQVNGTQIAGTDTSTYALNFISGTGITVTGASGSSSAANNITITNAGVRSTTINGNYLRVNTNGTNTDLTIPYATTASLLSNTSVSDPSKAASGLYLKWYSLVNQASGYAGTNYGFPVSNNANGILWLGTHSGPYGWQMGFSSNGRIYARYISNNTFSTTANGGSWNKIAWTSDIPTKTSQLTNDSGFVTGGPYLPLSGGVLSGHLALGTPATTALLLLSIERNNNKLSMLISGANEGWLLNNFSSGKSTALIQNETRGLLFKDTYDNYFNVWHAGNDGSGSGLDADLLDGRHSSGFAIYEGIVGANDSSGVASIGYTYATQEHGGLYAGGFINFGTNGYFCQLNGNVSQSALAYRFYNTEYGKFSDWKSIAFTDSNVASATKLQTVRTIWGQSFDGSGNVSGNMTGVGSITMSSDVFLNNNMGIAIKNTSGAYKYILLLSNNNRAYFGWPDLDSYIRGNNVNITYGSSQTSGIYLNSSGNVGIGTTNPGYKLEVNGTAASRSFRILNNSSSKDSWLHFSPYDSDATTSFGISGSYSNLGLTIYNYHVGASSLTIGKNSNNVGIGTTSPYAPLSVNGHVHVGNSSYKLSSPWKSGIVVGPDGTDKIVATYLASATNGATVGAHNSELSAWAPLHLGGTNIQFRVNESLKMMLYTNGQLAILKTGAAANSGLVVGGDSTKSNISTAIADLTAMIQLVAGSGGNTNSTAIGFHNPGISSAALEYRNTDVNTGYFKFRSDDSTWGVGINNTGNPRGLLDVNGDIYTNPYIRFVDSLRYCGYCSGGKYLELHNGVGGVGIHLYDDGNAYVYKSGNPYTIIHSGNYSSYALPFYTKTSGDCNSMSLGLTVLTAVASNQYLGNHSAFLTITSIGTPFQLQIPDSSEAYIYKRYKSGSSWSGWSKLSAGYADSAGYATSAGNADTVDGVHASSLSQIKYIGNTPDFCYDVILLCKRDVAHSARLDGLLFTTGGGVCRYHCADAHFWHSCWSVGSYDTQKSISNKGYDGYGFEFCTCTYGGAVWYAIKLDRTQAVSYFFMGNWDNINWTLITYYHTSQGVKNSEIYNSISNLTSTPLRYSGSIYAHHFYESSDSLLKTNIVDINSSDNIPQLKSFDWKSDGSHSYGLIALELEEMGYPELVSNNGSYKTVNYSAALSLIVGKLQVKIKELEKEIEILKNKN